MTVDGQIQIGLLLAYAAGLGALTLLLGAAMDWLLGPVQPERMVSDDLPAFARPVVTHRCAWCREARVEVDLLRVDGIGLVCREGCDDGRAA